MRHQKKKLLELNTWVKKKSIFIKEMLHNLVLNWKVITTPKRAKVLKAEADKFFSKIISMNEKYEDKDSRREIIRYIKTNVYWENAGKKVLNELFDKYVSSWKKSWFVKVYKLWFRKWDWVEKILVKLD